ncbi:hypothetical protein KX928_21815 [Roseobacter sp. YSTF-M11]|uniref:Uncharacterized protein n=1 Tax=Roseobacter insulae TaxID=2859783 RepID=A0A9X1FZA6_9RHOB|nr:hypothetical protein [Roseobacter insulae]MBW4710436.1 hypothetical protein [Roseobacter insulae]
MTGPLASAAPSRLRKAAQAGAGRGAAVFLRRLRAQTVVLENWQRAARQHDWLHKDTRLRLGPPMGSGLHHWCSAPLAETAQEAAPRPLGKAPIKPATPVPPRRQPSFLKPSPSKATAVAPGAGADIKTLPAKVGGGRLRLWSKTEASFLEKPSGSQPSAIALARRPRPGRSPLPDAGIDWKEPLRSKAMQRLSAHGVPQDRPRGLSDVWERPVAGIAAPIALLRHLLSPPPRATGQNTASRPGTAAQFSALGTAPIQHPGDPMAHPREKVRRNPQFADTPPNERVGHPAPQPLQDSSAQRPAIPQLVDPAPPDTRDPLHRDTLAPPPHHTPVPLPPQPDLTPPVAAIIAPADRAALTRAQGAVEDEPPEPAPQTTRTMPHPPRFDRADLGDALAKILRDEARRHGIDV